MRRRTLLSGAATIAGGTLLAACAGKAGTQRGSAVEVQPDVPRRGGTISLNVGTDPFDWDLSYLGKSTPNSSGTSLAYDALLTFKRGPDVRYGDLIVQPRLAERWESPDAQTYTFHLRRNLTFAGLPPVNGRALTSADVRWTFEYWSRTGQFRDKKLPQAQFDWFFEGLDAIETPDPATVVVRFKQPFAPFLNYAASDYNVIVPHEIFDQDGHFKNRLAGSGPYQLDEASSQKGTRWVWKRNPSYWDSGKPYLDALHWLVIPENGTAIAAFRTKQLDWLGNDILTYQQAAELKKAAPAATLYANLAINPLHLYMNIRQGPLADVRIRRAISYAIDRDEFIRTINGGQGGWALAGAFPDTFTQEEVKQIVPYDLQQAKQLLAQAGFASGLDLEFTYPGNDYGDVYFAQMQLLQAQLKKAGINLQLKNQDKADYSNSKKAGKFVITLGPKGSLEGDIDSYLFASFYSGSKANYGGSKDQKLDDLLLAQRREADPAKRKEIIRQAVRYVNDTAQGLAINYGMTYEFAQPHLKNYSPQFGIFARPQVDSWLQPG